MISASHSKHWKLQPLGLALALCVAAIPSYLPAQDVGGTDDAKKEVSAIKRDPFWPVGYVPESVKAALAAKANPQTVRPTVGNDWNKAMKNVVINGVSSRADNEFFAVVNGQVKSVGDTVTVNYQGTVYTWAVEGIKPPGSVKLRRVSAL